MTGLWLPLIFLALCLIGNKLERIADALEKRNQP